LLPQVGEFKINSGANMNTHSYDESIFQGLKAFSEASFPKKCSSCGRYFEDMKAFVNQTKATNNKGSGLKSGLNTSEKPFVELYRNCPCGSTLRDVFNDRRDSSASGVKRRELFGQLLNMLEKKGLATHRARQELLKILRGEGSTILAKMGIETRKL